MRTYTVCTEKEQRLNRAAGIPDDSTTGAGWGWWINASTPKLAIDDAAVNYPPGTKLIAVELPKEA